MMFIAQEIAKTRKQSQFLYLVTNILNLGLFINKNIYLGSRFLVKGKIGRHGRTKTFYNN
jgi:hypothetical protein